MIRSLTRRLLHKEDGMALVMALAAMTVLAITTTGVIVSGTANESTAFVSLKERAAFAVAQEALAYGEGMVYGDVQGSPSTSPPTATQSLPTQPGGAIGTYHVSTTNGTTWTVVGIGTVGNVSRTVSANVTPLSSQTTSGTAIWGYLYADSTSTCMSFTGNVAVSVPVLARGNICLSGSAHMMNPFGQAALSILAGGTLSDIGGAYIGIGSSPVGSVGIGGCTAWNSTGACTATTSTGCTVQQTSVVSVAPGTGVCNGLQSPLFANSVSTSLSVTPALPCIGQSSTLNPQCPSSAPSWSTLNSIYNTQKAATKTGCPANLLDSDSTLNNSLSASTLSSAMFPKNSSYDCKVTSGGTTIGEIKWNAVGQYCGTGTLTVSGTLYFDGSLDFGCGWKIQYTGQASLYFTGTVEQEGGTQLCGIANCTSSWNPNVNGIIFVAGCWKNSTGSTLVTSECVYVTGGSTAQWGAYATTEYQVDGGSSNMGPALANTITLGGGATALIPFTTLPPGTPTASTTTTVPGTPPTNWSG